MKYVEGLHQMPPALLPKCHTREAGAAARKLSAVPWPWGLEMLPGPPLQVCRYSSWHWNHLQIRQLKEILVFKVLKSYLNASIGIVIALYIRCPCDKGVVQCPGDQLTEGGWVSVCSVFSIISSHNNIYLSTPQSGALVLVTPVLKREDNKRVIQLTTITPEITLPLLCPIRCIKMHNIYMLFEMQSIKN